MNLMNKFYLTNHITLLILFSFNISFAQEKITGLQVNAVLKNHYQKQFKTEKSKSIQITDTIELPFFEDFSKNTVYPDTNLWTDRFAFINYTYGINPVSVGVATLDAIDYSGAIYPNANSTGFKADELTSKPINLAYPPESNIYLSFYYQPQGIADPPDFKDSLVLEFYSPSDTGWYSVWQTHGDTLQEFKQIIIPVTDQKFLTSGFRFRFKNYASLTSNTLNPGMVANCDHWQIDYIILDKERSEGDSIPHDVAFVKPLGSLIKNYEAMPWDHFRESFLTVMNDRISISYKNNDDIIRNVTRKFDIRDIYENKIVRSFSGGAANIGPWEIINHDALALYTYNSPGTDSALFELKSYMITDDFDKKDNDTIVYLQNFYNFYAYDDGTAEAGYGLNGLSMNNAMLAYQFYSYKPDSLRAVQMYFNQSFENANQSQFYLCVWEDDNGTPGELILSQQSEIPVFEDSLNKFHTYFLDTAVFVSETFYIGWTQITDAFLNVGFDMNTIKNDKIFFTYGGVWNNSELPGALMIRPVLGTNLISGLKKAKLNNHFRIYPNPAKDHIRIEYLKSNPLNNPCICIYNSYGQKVYTTNILNLPIDISEMLPGIYFVMILEDGVIVTNKKIIIVR
jgi:hypothetical protein